MKTLLTQWHKRLVWFGLAAIICWAVSGISHPLMAWFGPQANKMFPPRLTVNSSDVMAIDTIISRHQLSNAAVAKLIPTGDGAMLQLTTETAANNSGPQPRRYFSLTNGDELANYDKQQAKWLAAYYTGIDITQVKSVQFIRNFSNEYPRINRLLPVYQVNIGEGDALISAFVYTETNALAALNNTSKRRLQTLFQALHTWSWLDITGQGRVVLMALLLLTLFAMVITGMLLVINLPSRTIKDKKRRWHRSLAYLLWLPLLGWSASGFYHLLQSHYIEPVSGIRLGNVVNLQQWPQKTVDRDTWLSNFQNNLGQNQALNAVSLVNGANNNYYRLSVARTHTQKVTRNARFDGQSSEKAVLYINSQSGLPDGHNDRVQAIELMKQFNGANTQYSNIERVVRFGANYDFRNKRLPVWQLNIDDAVGSRIFVDPTTGILVDQNRRYDRIESWSFSVLHKWNLITPFIGRQWRDVAIIITLVACLLMSALGLSLYLTRARRTKNPY